MAKYLITGGCGYIGSHLCFHLKQKGHNVIVLDNLSSEGSLYRSQHIEFIKDDMRNSSLLSELFHSIDGCFHLVNNTLNPNSSYSTMNQNYSTLECSISLFEAARKITHRRIPIVYTSNASIYGNNASIPLTESSVSSPISVVGVDKVSAEMYAHLTSVMHGLPIIGFRIFNVYGPELGNMYIDDDLMSVALKAINKGNPIDIYGKGEQTRDFIFIDDTIKYLSSAIQINNPSHKIFNICTGKGTSVNQFVKTVFTIFGQQLKVTYKPRKYEEIYSSIGDPRKIQTYFNHIMPTSLGNGIYNTMLSYRETNYSMAS